MYNYQSLYDKFSDIIAKMKPEFTSHEFILLLAQKNQVEYIEALYNARLQPNPFQIVHRVLSQRLSEHSAEVKHVGETESIDIFGNSNRCSNWVKLDVIGGL